MDPNLTNQFKLGSENPLVGVIRQRYLSQNKMNHINDDHHVNYDFTTMNNVNS